MKLERGKQKDKAKDRDMRKPLKVEWIVVIVSIVLLSCCYMYTDLPFTSSSGMRVWNCISEGTPELFYWSAYPGVEGSALPDGSSGGSYDFMIYLIFAIYNLPLWIWEKITGYSFLMFFTTRIMAKGILWLFSGVSAYLVYKIAEVSGAKKENAIWAPILFLTSGIFFATEVTIGGYDVISVAFSLLGIYGYLKKNNRCFLGSFAIAIATKLFAFWLFIPLLLLKEKKIWKLALETLAVLSAIIVPKLYFLFASQATFTRQAQEAIEKGEETLGYMPVAVNDVIAHSNVIDEALFPSAYTAQYTFFSIENLPLVFVGMFAIWIACYLIKRELKAEEVIYLCALVMSVFIITVKVHPYWGILLVPYLSLIMVLNPSKIKENILLETLMSVGYVMNKAILYSWCFGMAQIERMAGPNYQFSYDPETTHIGKYGLERLVYKLSQKVGIGEANIAHTFSALFVVSTIIFLYLNWPSKIEEKECLIGDVEGVRKGMNLRFLFSLFVGLLPMIGLLVYITPFYWGD